LLAGRCCSTVGPAIGAEQPARAKASKTISNCRLRPWIRHAARLDYVFVAFAGHGYVIKEEYSFSTVACVSDAHDVRIRDLNPGNKRCVVVADCCRSIETEIPVELVESVRRYTKAAQFVETRRYRDLFDRAVECAEEGVVYLYSCDQNQTAADDDDQGGLFTFHLLKGAVKWAGSQPEGAVLSADKAFDTARTRVMAAEPQQHPTMGGVRRRVYFPFAVT
jgi:hypothetical protein